MRKRYKASATPFRRLVQSEEVTEAMKQRLAEQFLQLDPLLLLKHIRNAQTAVVALSQNRLLQRMHRSSCVVWSPPEGLAKYGQPTAVSHKKDGGGAHEQIRLQRFGLCCSPAWRSSLAWNPRNCSSDCRQVNWGLITMGNCARYKGASEYGVPASRELVYGSDKTHAGMSLITGAAPLGQRAMAISLENNFPSQEHSVKTPQHHF